LKDKTYRREWAQNAARSKLREMRGRGMSDAMIGRRIGGDQPISGTFISALLRDVDPKPVSYRVWQALVEMEGLPTAEPRAEATTDPTNSVQVANDQPTTDLSAQLAALNNSINGLLAANVILAQQVQAALAELSRLRKQQSDPKGQ